VMIVQAVDRRCSGLFSGDWLTQDRRRDRFQPKTINDPISGELEDELAKVLQIVSCMPSYSTPHFAK
jgi:hypothetical protein